MAYDNGGNGVKGCFYMYYYLSKILPLLVMPLGIVLFLCVWQFSANRIDTSLGQFPGPVQVWEQIQNLGEEHNRERDKEAAFYERQEKRNADRVAKVTIAKALKDRVNA